jgi:hypothetical protein
MAELRDEVYHPKGEFNGNIDFLLTPDTPMAPEEIPDSVPVLGPNGRSFEVLR